MEKKEVEITSVIDSAKYVGMPLAITILTIFIMLADGFDLGAMGFVVPELVKEWGLPRQDFTWSLLASMFGMMPGSFLLGWAGDRIGRKNAYIICIFFLAIGSYFCAHADNTTELIIWRVVTGFGLGGVTPLAATMISEWTPKHARYVAVACAIVAVPLGGMVGAWAAQHIIPTWGWRGVFMVGAYAPLAFFIVALFLYPESPKYLAQRPHLHAKLGKLLNRLVKEQRFTGNEKFIVNEPPAPPGNWFGQLFSKEYRSTTLLLWAAFTLNTLALYTFFNLLTTILTSTGMSTVEALEGSKYLNLGGFFGSVGGAFLIGYFGSRYVGSGIALLGAISAFFIGMTVLENTEHLTVQMLVLFLFAGIAVNGMQSFLYTVGAYSYPTYIRASGVGVAQAVSRFGGLFGTWAGTQFFAIKPQPPISVIFYVVGGVIVLVMITFYSLRTHIPPGKQDGSGPVPAPSPQKA